MTNSYILKSLLKGIQVLEIINDSSTPLSLSEISKKASINNVRCTRICRTLDLAGYLYRDQQKRYHASPRLLSFGYSTINKYEWIHAAQYYLQLLYDKVGGIVSVGILDSPNIVYLIRFGEEEFVSVDIRVGTRVPIYCTAMGKVMLAMSPSEKVKRIISEINIRPITQFTVRNKNQLIAELKQVKKKGYAINDEELVMGSISVAAPIVDGNGYAVAAVNVSQKKPEWDREKVERQISSEVIKCSHSISKSLLHMSHALKVNVEYLVKQKMLKQKI